jgi:hypothetical protein
MKGCGHSRSLRLRMPACLQAKDSRPFRALSRPCAGVCSRQLRVGPSRGGGPWHAKGLLIGRCREQCHHVSRSLATSPAARPFPLAGPGPAGQTVRLGRASVCTAGWRPWCRSRWGFLIAFVWLGMAHPPRTSIAGAPLAALAYVLPLLYLHASAGARVYTTVLTIPLCVLVAEGTGFANCMSRRPSSTGARR